MSKNSYHYGIPHDLPKKMNLSSYSVSIPGFRTFIDHNKSNYKKAVWGFLLLVSLCFAVFQICERAQNFLSYPVHLEFKMTSRRLIQFPSFTICPYNVFLSKHILGEIENQSVASVYDLLSLPGFDLNTIWNMTEIDLPSFTKACKYAGGTRCNDPPFTLWKKQSTILGICHTLDFPKVGYYGVFSGFMLQATSKNNFADGIKSKNYMFAVHNRDDDITYGILTEGFEAYESTLNHVYYVHLLKIYQNLTNRPCYSNEQFQTCKLRCYDKHVLKNSHCRLPFMKTSMLRLCSTPEEFKQIYPIPIQEKVYFDDIKDCIGECGQPCIRSIYDENVETKTYASRKDHVNIKINPLREGTAIVKETFSYSIVAFTCDVGAILGLYLGISVLSITEIIELLIDAVKTRYSKERQSK